MNTLDGLRASVGRVILGLVWMQTPLAAVVAVLAGNAWFPVTIAAAAIAVAATVVSARAPNSQSSRLTTGVALIAGLSLILAACAGSRYQLDLHMAYFAELAVLTAFCDRSVVLAGAGTIALHHLVLSFVMPALVFPDGGQLIRVALHAAMVVLEAAVLVWLTHHIVLLFCTTAANLSAAVAAAAQTREAEAQAAEQRRLSEETRAQADTERAAAASEQRLVVAALSEGLESLARGDVSVRLTDVFAADYEALRGNFNNAVVQLDALLRNVVSNAEAIRSGTEEIMQASDQLSHRTEQQAASLGEAAAALDQITATVRTTAEGAHQASTVVARTRADADRSGAIVQQAIAAMGTIE